METDTLQRNRLGAYGEAIAARYLVREAGMLVLDRNWHSAHGELDLVLRDGNILVACEVKTRSSLAKGEPLEAIGAAKIDRLKILIEQWREIHQVRAHQIRLDLVGVLLSHGQVQRIDHVRGVA
ncbi:MAG: YraN family protein [Nocardioidaceae bacterium]